MGETLLKPTIAPAVAQRIEALSGEILPLRSRLTELVTVNGIREPEVLDAFLQPLLAKVQGTGRGGEPERLLHALGGNFA